MRERLQKILSRAGLASRRAAEQLILEGRIQVDGEIVRRLGASADPETQDIRLDDRRVRTDRARRYLLLNKPVGYLTTRSDPEKRRTVMELLPRDCQSLYPVGRLDGASSGLLIFPDRRALARAARGIRVGGERLKVERASVLRHSAPPPPRLRRGSGPDVSELRVVLREGRNRELRRIFLALGHPVQKLHRERIANVSDRGLPMGSFRSLEAREIRELKRLSATSGTSENRVRKAWRKK